MRKILIVAAREFLATAATKAFILGAFVIPVVILAVVIVGFRFLLKEQAPAVTGSVAVIDASGRAIDGLRERLLPEAIAARNREMAGDLAEEVEQRIGAAAPGVGESVRTSIESEIANVPKLTVDALDPAADVENAKDPLRQGSVQDGGRQALVVIAPDAVERAAGSKEFGGFELFIRHKLDDRVESEIRNAAREAIKQARIRAAAIDPEEFKSLAEVRAPRTREVGPEGERDSMSELRLLVSVGLMAILMVSVMVGGQSLLTTTVEEKASRVVEVLLAALSPMELMAGKILGQLAVSLTILLVYASAGGGALAAFSLGYLIGPMNFVYLLLFFLIAYFTVGALLAAVGAAVNDLREAQSLQTPVIMSIVLPYMLWLPISRDPNGLFATICSFVPPIGPFVMILRVTASEPPPHWQIAAAILVGMGGVWASIWFASKVFRIGLLMFGKPPNFATLWRWVRMS